jgi:hypothetical protein
MIRKTDDGESLMVPIASRDILAGEMSKASLLLGKFTTSIQVKDLTLKNCSRSSPIAS